jgi:hypothetical protein
VKAEERARFADAIAYTTHALLDNLAPLLKRWQGLVSILVLAPGTDWAAIKHVCHSSQRAQLIRRWVTSHLYFPSNHDSKKVGKKILTEFLSGG